METNKYTNPFGDGGQLSLSQSIADEQKWRYWLEVIDRDVINGIASQLQGFEKQHSGQSVNFRFRCPFCSAQQKTPYEKTRVTACLRETGGRSGHGRGGYQFHCFRCKSTYTLFQFLMETGSSQIADQYRWDRFRRKLAGAGWNCPLPPKEQRDALKNPLYAGSDVPPPSKADRAAAHKRRYEDQKRLNYIHKHGCPPPRGKSD